MLERIEEIKGVGLLHDANGKPFKFQKVTLVYGDNGRGKSTLASIFGSLQSGDAALILDRATIDGSHSPSVALQFGSGIKTQFTARQWSSARPEFLVFDSNFVEKNVHSGGNVNTDHRKNLLQFALGERAVQARLAEERATLDARKAAEEIQKEVTLLSGHHVGLPLEEFESLEAVSDVDAQLEDLEKRIVSARSSALLLARPVFDQVQKPTSEISAIFSVLHHALENVQHDAEKVVRAHVARINDPGAEGWLSQGQSFADGGQCPYCGQSLSGLEIIEAYRTHFNAAYADLKKRVIALDRQIASVSEFVVKDFAQKVAAASSSAQLWSDQVAIPQIRFEEDGALGTIRELSTILQTLIDEKRANPIEPAGTDLDRKKVEKLWAEIGGWMDEANAGIRSARQIVDECRKNLASQDVHALISRKSALDFSKKRHSQTVTECIARLGVARASSAAAEEGKTAARAALDALMASTLADYEKSINDLLAKFGASFKIYGMGANYRGGSPRSEYGLELRGKPVALEGGPPAFGTALSEGDKRTLAFAFFIASTLGDANLATRVVVIDDPMCSLDIHRKQQTRSVLRDVSVKAAQLIVLAHDIYFVRDLRDHLTPSDSSFAVTSFALKYAGNGYSNFASLDIDKECQSPYYYHHSLLVTFVTTGQGDTRVVAKGIRPLLEGYLHRRFPGLVPKELMFGQVVTQIGNAVHPSPLCHAQCLIPELKEINSYAGQFHHDTNPGNADTIQVNPSELHTFAARTLQVIYKGRL